MKQKYLKNIRVGTAAAVFVLFGFMFLSKSEFAVFLCDYGTKFQFVPGLLEFMAQRGLFIFLVLILLTLLFGRVYCSFLCPLGIMQDIIICLTPSKKLSGKKFKKSNPWIKYSLMGIFVCSLSTFFLTFVTLLDPYSIFGRIMTHLVQPVTGFFYNLLVSFLEWNRVYSLYKTHITHFLALPFFLTLGFAALIFFLAMYHGRSYCNNICPVGSFLGGISKISLFKIRLTDSCKKCGLCQAKCKSHCIDFLNKKIGHENCVACFNCLSACKENLVVYDATRMKEKLKRMFISKNSQTTENTEVSSIEITSRRDFLKGSAIAGSCLAATLIPGHFMNTAHVAQHPVMPPGAASSEKFLQKCTACHLCVNHCTGHVLRPAAFEYGVTGIMAPLMDYKKGFCQYECNICSQVCPSGAISPVPIEEKKLTQIGVVELWKDRCVVYTKKKDCAACAEHCPTKAVFTVPYQDNKLLAPEVDPEICIGCGACEYACPVTPAKAITIKANKVHKKSQKKKQKTEDKKIQDKKPEDDFPF